MMDSFRHYNSISCNSSSSSTNDSIFLISDLLHPLDKEEEKTNYSICSCFYSCFQRYKKWIIIKNGLKMVIKNILYY